VARLLAVGHVTWDRREGIDVLGGSAAYASLAARALGWDAAVLTSAGADFDPGRDLPGIETFVHPASATTRFQNLYDAAGERRQVLSSRADDIELVPLPDAWRNPDVLLLGPVAGEIGAGAAQAFEAEVVGALAQGWLRQVDSQGYVSPREWVSAAANLAGVHALFLSEHDLGPSGPPPAALLAYVPLLALTRGWQGLTLLTRTSAHEVPSLPRTELDPTGAGDVFAAAFLVRYHEARDPLEAAAFGACAASCVVEGVGASSLGDREEVLRRLALRERLIEEGEWDE
jgi:sugar/nucleoside kinase (ribokinase family)